MSGWWHKFPSSISSILTARSTVHGYKSGRRPVYTILPSMKEKHDVSTSICAQEKWGTCSTCGKIGSRAYIQEGRDQIWTNFPARRTSPGGREVILASGESLYSLEEVGGADFLLAVSQFSALRARALFRTSSSDKFENDK